MKPGFWLLILILLMACACGPSRQLRNQIQQVENDFQDHVGFVLYDPHRGETLFDYQGDRYFIPASNTKILTLFASLQLLGDSIPSLRYVVRGDSLIFWGTGDPGFLYNEVVRSDRTLNFLRTQTSKLYFSSANFASDYFGPGWSWDDYRYTYQVERTPFPIYGNRFNVRRTGRSFETTPAIFKSEVKHLLTPKDDHDLIRGLDSNALTYIPGLKDSTSDFDIPFRYSDSLLVRLLSDTLKREVNLLPITMPTDARIFHDIPSDSLYKVMMQESDNFIAEQLLMMCGGTLTDTLSVELAIREVKKQFLHDMPNPPVWMDGSGLSRMNLLTPRSVVFLWDKVSGMIPQERLLAILAVGGVNGTLRNYFKSDKPYIFGKTGSLRNNHNLSGFLVTRSGRTLLFSWMNNNFTTGSTSVRKRMEIVLQSIYEKY
ncbi:MAG: D-alanyl-D-alanine carboxypeptidase [Cyclobacteriaceae bacterium]|nr:D-alanyl-D-alanine carboxypeptidase [Cyclobacteriaceae bacterium]